MHDFYSDIYKSSLYHLCEFYVIRTHVRNPTSYKETLKTLLEFIHSNEICEIASKNTCKTPTETGLPDFHQLICYC